MARMTLTKNQQSAVGERLYASGMAAKDAGRLDDAEAQMAKILALWPNALGARYQLGLIQLARGNYLAGFANFEARHQLALSQGLVEKLPFPEWRGEDLSGKSLVVMPEQGFGDQIQFARFLKQIPAAKITVVAPRPLARLMATLGVEVILQGEPIPPHDFAVYIGSLAHRLGVSLESIPQAPYMAVPLIGEPGPKIGVVWAGRPQHENDAHRSFAQALLQPLASTGREFVPLAPEATRARDFYDTAGIINRLDLVITVDTAVAHLAGAMGKPVWILLPAVKPDWRWMQERNDSPWYPTARLFRQPAPGAWPEVIEQVVEALKGA
jgi:hypothetical protein